jgi:hypothetical protein
VDRGRRGKEEGEIIRKNNKEMVGLTAQAIQTLFKRILGEIF